VKLSIITINLNNSIGLKKTLQSVFDQSFSDYEIIIIDGGSTDLSSEIILQYNTITVRPFISVSESDTGIYNAQNKGIKLAKGEYCLFLNSGDYLVNEKVLEHFFSNNPSSDILIGNLLITKKDKVVDIIKGKAKYSFLDVYSSLIKHQSSFIKRSLFDKYGLYDESLKILSDWAFFLKTVGINSVTTEYFDLDITYFDNEGISNRNPEICMKERQIILDNILPPLIQVDYMVFQKFCGIYLINKYKIGRIVYRILVKTLKILG
jgi:glycosyltransferase involved in cell wall biosynthesis